MSPGVALAWKEASALLRRPHAIGLLGLVVVAMSAACLALDANAAHVRAVHEMSLLVIVAGALLSVVVGTDTLAGEYDRVSLLPLLLSPLSRAALVTGKLGGLFTAWLILCVIAAPFLWTAGGERALASVVLFGTPLVMTFGLFALGLGVWLTPSRASLAVAMLILLVSAGAVFIGVDSDAGPIGPLARILNPLSAVDLGLVRSGMAGWPELTSVFAWLGASYLFALASAARLGRAGR